MPAWTINHTDYTFSNDAQSCRFSNDGHYAVGSKDGFVRYYDSSHSLVWLNQRSASSNMLGVDFSPNSSFLLAAWSRTGTKKIGIFDVSINGSEFNISVGTMESVDWS